MTICKGIVKDNVVLLDEGVQPPEGAEVEVRLFERPLTRQEVFARMRGHRIMRAVGMDAILADDKQEHEEHHAHDVAETGLGLLREQTQLQSGRSGVPDGFVVATGTATNV